MNRLNSLVTSAVLWLTALAMCAAVTGCHSSRHASSASSAGAVTSRPATPKRLGKPDPSLPEPTRRLLAEADGWIGVPYKYAGTDRKGVDCSALMLRVYADALAISLPRNSARQAEFCTPVKRENVVPGDLMFFSTPNSRGIGHVGIYVGNDCMIHASGSRGVELRCITEPYYIKHFKCAGRVEAYQAMLDGADKKASGKKRKGKKQKSRHNDPTPAVPAVQPAELPAVDPLAAPPRQVTVASAGAVSDAVPPVTAARLAAAGRQQPSAATSRPAPAVSATGVRVIAAGTDSIASLGEEEARRRVLSTYRELPPDSVMTAYFD